ncbi:hypothetical protein RF11_08423 [Thelohanellus kitauei]|uniref:Uncharacterized protein n=1 Tax=Thelohanellus kitauei TaxID=669202 RepID=A0A0C2M597_THEKT|nr:hypothetical protein RF11_08423 [Thelohanellus kitauei]
MNYNGGGILNDDDTVIIYNMNQNTTIGFQNIICIDENNTKRLTIYIMLQYVVRKNMLSYHNEASQTKRLKIQLTKVEFVTMQNICYMTLEIITKIKLEFVMHLGKS